ncbi:MAG: hypothetical protein ACOCPM_07260 [Bacteroidales bacterium]
MNISKESEKLLLQFIPSQALPQLKKWLEAYPVQIAIVDQRKTKAGDYRPAQRYKPPKITVNVDRNAYRFLITLIHELAHHMAFSTYGPSIKPHGYQWKETYFNLLSTLKHQHVFPEELAATFPLYPAKLKASTAGNSEMNKKLKAMDHPGESYTYIEDITNGSVFYLDDGQSFKKIKKRRVRYLCQNLDNKNYYLLPPGVQIYINFQAANRN